MTYQVSYLDMSAAFARERSIEPASRIERFLSETAAMARARELLDNIDYENVAVHPDRGEIVTGVRLQLRLGLSVE